MIRPVQTGLFEPPAVERRRAVVHPLDQPGAERGRYVLGMGLQLVAVAALLVAAAGVLLASMPVGLVWAAGGLAGAAGAGRAGRVCRRRAWSQVLAVAPALGAPALPLAADRCFAAAAGVLLAAGAMLAGRAGPAGAVLAAVIAVAALAAAADSVLWLHGRARCPARRVPAFLVAAGISSAAAVVAAGLAPPAVWLFAGTVMGAALVAAGVGLRHRAVRS